MDKKDFKVGESVRLEVYNYDSDGCLYKVIKEGKVIQLTDCLIVINNGLYNESFQYTSLSQLEPCQTREAYYSSLQTYQTDIVEKCVERFKEGKEGYVFNLKQVHEALKLIYPDKYSIRQQDNIYFIKKI